MVYVALLRGINVDGNSVIPMIRLKALLEVLGLKIMIRHPNTLRKLFELLRSPETKP